MLLKPWILNHSKDTHSYQWKCIRDLIAKQENWISDLRWMLHCSIHGIRIDFVASQSCLRHLGVWPDRSTATLTTRTVVDNFVCEKIAVYTEVVPAYRAFIATADTYAFCLALRGLPLVLGGYWRKRYSTCKAVCTLRGTLPWYLHPVDERK